MAGTWEHIGNHAKPPQRVAEILDPRLPPERVRQLVELLYHRDASLSEKVAWRLRKQRQVYPAEFLKVEGVPYYGEITCGHNPWLRARLVDDLEIVRRQDGTETTTWKDRYDLREIRKKIVELKKAGISLPAQ
ncbi:MAG: hypothetical protein ABR881_19265 [Candidatus Sulfotelmatobacter sp.]